MLWNLCFWLRMFHCCWHLKKNVNVTAFSQCDTTRLCKMFRKSKKNQSKVVGFASHCAFFFFFLHTNILLANQRQRSSLVYMAQCQEGQSHTDEEDRRNEKGALVFCPFLAILPIKNMNSFTNGVFHQTPPGCCFPRHKTVTPRLSSPWLSLLPRCGLHSLPCSVWDLSTINMWHMSLTRQEDPSP